MNLLAPRAPSNSSLQTLDPNRNSLPFFLNPDSLTCQPILSHNAVSHNVVIKVTVPKRTGRKRKRGTDDPFEDFEEGTKSPSPADDSTPAPSLPSAAEEPQVLSQKRMDEPQTLRQKLLDNVGRYKVAAVGTIHHTHRYRGMMPPLPNRPALGAQRPSTSHRH